MLNLFSSLGKKRGLLPSDRVMGPLGISVHFGQIAENTVWRDCIILFFFQQSKQRVPTLFHCKRLLFSILRVLKLKCKHYFIVKILFSIFCWCHILALVCNKEPPITCVLAGVGKTMERKRQKSCVRIRTV